ncbi:MAG: sialate O-acetylesterase, partial [Verrucomicrobiota bacterium]
MLSSIRLFFLLIIGSAFPFALEAATPHGLFTDHMVLQRDQPIRVYGTGADGETVKVTLDGDSASANVKDGEWLVTLPAKKAGGPYVLTIEGSETHTLDDVMVGDVWLCTGQSNMAGMLGSYINKAPELYTGHPKTNDRIRLFKLKQDGADEPQRDVVTQEDFGPSWRLCDEESAPLFSATGYLFGQALQPEVDVPVGLIYATLGGTKAESWVSREILESRPEYEIILDEYEDAVVRHPQAFEVYKTRLAEWRAKPPEERRGTRQPQAPMGPNHPKRPSGLFYFMISPLQQFPVKGAIWYQGEGNSGRPEQYQKLFPDLITSWREQWGQGDFPFLFVQLAAFRAYNEQPEDTDWARLREAQTMTLSLPNTGMATIIDVGHQTDIHPPDKVTVGERLAASALEVAYGKDVVGSGPMFHGMEINGSEVTLTFDNVGSGLTTRAVETDGLTVPAEELAGFAVCGEDNKFHWAEAKITGKDTIVLSSPEVEAPLAVRYAWANFPRVNLYNEEGFPAVPFRTDQFPRLGTGTVTGIAVGKPHVCNQPIQNGKWGGLTDGNLGDSNLTAWASNGSMNFPKHVTVDLEGRFQIEAVRVHNSAQGGTKTVQVELSTDGETFNHVGETEFENYSMDAFEIPADKLSEATHVRLVFPDIHDIGFQKKKTGFVFLRELE